MSTVLDLVVRCDTIVLLLVLSPGLDLPDVVLGSRFSSVYIAYIAVPVMSTRYCYFCVMDALFTPWLDEADVVPTKMLAKDCRCD